MKINANEIKPGMIIEHRNDCGMFLKHNMGTRGEHCQVELKVFKRNKIKRDLDRLKLLRKVDEKFNFLYRRKIVISWTIQHLNKLRSPNQQQAKVQAFKENLNYFIYGKQYL